MTSTISSINIDSIVTTIESNGDLIEYNYKENENQILIPKELVDKTYSLMSSMGLETADFKETLKISIKKGFELSSNDVVVSKNGAFFIKLFEQTKKHEVDEKDKDTIASRYNGIEEEELEEFHNEFFADKENKGFFASIAVEFVDIYLKDKKISNENYEKNVFSYIHTLTFKHLVELYDDSDGFFKGFAGYVFRIHFKEVFEHIADLILDEISMANSHMIEFLKYYSLDIIVIGGRKYKVPALEAKDGLKWNVGSMLSIAKIYTKSKKSLKSLQKEIVQQNKEIKKLHINNLSPIELQKANIQKKQDLEIEISDANNELNRYLDALDSQKDEKNRQQIKKNIHIIKEDLNEMNKEKSDLSEVVTSKANLAQYSQLQKDIDSLSRQLKREQLMITQNAESYQSIRESLVKALISKKSLL